MPASPPPFPAAPPAARAPRGRPRSITRARIAEAGMTIGLPHITFVGVAAALGVSHMALYKHVDGLAALRQLVAEEIFRRWDGPLADAPQDAAGGLATYLEALVASLRALVRQHPGLAPWLLRRSRATQPMLEKIRQHQQQVARAFGLPEVQARWLLATIAFHCIAVADTVYAAAAPEDEADAADEVAMEREFTQGMAALIAGALLLLEQENV